MSHGFVETTVLTDFLLKRDGSEKAAANSFKRFSQVSVPQYAWKEFKRGPLANFLWAYNKLSETGSFTASLAALQRMSRSPKRYLTSTAIQAFHSAFVSFFDSATLHSLGKQYGAKADLDALHADFLRFEIKAAIVKSWGRRHAILGGPVHILECYPDAEIRETTARIEIEPRDCPRSASCCLKTELRTRARDVAAVRASLRSIPRRKEITSRSDVLRHIEKHKSASMTYKDCRHFGDAYFVLFCPTGATILTTNQRDIEPMAKALGIQLERP